MGSRYKITDIDNESFYQLPKSLFSFERYRKMGLNSKVIYSMLKDRMCLSRKNGWKDDNGDIFLIFKEDDIGVLLNISKSTVSRAMKELKEFGLIDLVQNGYYRAYKVYIRRVSLPEDEVDVCEDPTEKTSFGKSEEEVHPAFLVPPPVIYPDVSSPQNEVNDVREAPQNEAHYFVRDTDKSPIKSVNTPCCTSETSMCQPCNSQVSSVQHGSCSSEITKLQQCNSQVSSVQPNNTEYSHTEISDNDFSENKLSKTEPFSLTPLREETNAPPGKVEKKGKGRNKKGLNPQEEFVLKGMFAKFWEAYPKRMGKQDAIRAFNRVCPDEALLSKMLQALEIAKRSRQWKNIQYVPYPATWLNRGQWEDEICESAVVNTNSSLCTDLADRALHMTMQMFEGEG